jgi:putative Mn2+ efflux pump MntP
VLLDSTPKEQHQTLLTVLEFGVKIATAGTGIGFAAILVGYPMITVISILFALSVILVLLGLMLYRAILVGKKQAEYTVAEG